MGRQGDVEAAAAPDGGRARQLQDSDDFARAGMVDMHADDRFHQILIALILMLLKCAVEAAVPARYRKLNTESRLIQQIDHRQCAPIILHYFVGTAHTN
jgi:hypothetical protein